MSAVDYALVDSGGNSAILAEAKRTAVDTGDGLNRAQAYDYASDVQTAGVVVSNGQYRATKLRDRNVIRSRSRNAGREPKSDRPLGLRRRDPGKPPDGSTAARTGRGTVSKSPRGSSPDRIKGQGPAEMPGPALVTGRQRTSLAQ